jgi:O-antigen/teichoic acid export membrane protein
VGHSSQALFAFFALSNADILVARATMSNSEAGLYAAGLIMVKAILFLPQFVVVIAFPSMSKEETSRTTLLLAVATSAALGAIGVVGTVLFPDWALLFVGGKEFEAVKDDLWKFAIVGTTLAIVQLLVYSALARRQGRAVIVIWTALATLVAVAISVGTADELVVVVVVIDAIVFGVLMAIALLTRPDSQAAPEQVDAPA